jgi:predicted ThiF/HesA family dinucleotide-utilizing enzyme
MSIAVRIVLLACAAASFAGVGASAAIRRFRDMQEMPDDQGFTAIAGMLLISGALCAEIAGGVAAVTAILIPVAGAAYAVTAQRLGVFRIETGEIRVHVKAETELHT